jgi:putative endonuclease
MSNARKTVLYRGISNDLVARVYKHKNKVLKGFTANYNVDKLVYYETYRDPNEAIAREKQIKNLVRRKKIALIASSNPEWKDLYDDL